MTPLLGTFSAASARGFGRGRTQTTPPYTGPTPEYWWRADSGLSTSGWTAYAGGLDFTFTNVSSADSTNGALFNGTSSEGVTGNVSSTFDVKHLLVRFDSLNKGAGSVRVFLGAGANNTLTAMQFYDNNGSPRSKWWAVAPDNASAVWGYYTTDDFGTSAAWVDYANNTSNPGWYADNADTLYTAGVYSQGSSSTYTTYFRYASGSPIYIGRRLFSASPGYLSAYIKEVAMFTTALTVEEGKSFRQSMFDRWP